MPLNVDRMVLNYDYDVRAYFIHEGAGYKNTVGVKLKDDHRLLFPDCSYDGNENVRLQRGDFVNLGLIKQGTKLDLLVIPNGAGGGLGGRNYRLYTTPSLSDDQRQHYVGFWIEDTPLLLFGAEDLLGGGDNDFEDVMVVLDFGLDYDPPKTYYVSTRGNDSNTGRTPNDPFRTITKAAQVVRPGDTVNVAAGTYTENPDFRISGNDLYSIRFIANGDVTVQSAQDNAWLMTMYYADYYVFDGFRFTGKNMGEGVRTYGVYNYHSDVTFRNCEFDSLYYGVHGVYSGTKLDRCRIHDNQAYALLNYYGGLDIKASEIKNNANGPYSYREHFFSMTDTKIEDNQGWAILYAFGPYGTHQPLGVNQPKVSNCTIRNNLNGLHLTFGKDKDRITFDRTTVQGLQGWEMYLSQCEYNIDER
ncbi:MAG TPA: right-handed parallel beta-helix repeat-containing protein, partial [Pirellulaceae bacterium]|nr:right-handed parallel beta-helix repeat-containing protein [Pirellulaceae bacterium]